MLQNGPVLDKPVQQVSPQNEQPLLNFASTANPLGPPKQFVKTAKRVAAGERFEMAKNVAAAYHGVNDNNILLGNGRVEMLYTIMRALRPRRALVPVPNDKRYKNAVRYFGGDIIPYQLKIANDFILDIDGFLKAIVPGVEMVILSNPNNPTSKITGRDDLLKILEYCQMKGIYVLVDEQHADFTINNISCVDLVESFANLLVLRSLDEYYALDQVRVAYVVACSGLCSMLGESTVPETVNAFACAAIGAVLGNRAYHAKTDKWLSEEAKRFYGMISSTGGVKVYLPGANYLFVCLGDLASSVFCQRMESKGVLVQDCTDFDGLSGNYVRISVRSKKENALFMDAFARSVL